MVPLPDASRYFLKLAKHGEFFLGSWGRVVFLTPFVQLPDALIDDLSALFALG